MWFGSRLFWILWKYQQRESTQHVAAIVCRSPPAPAVSDLKLLIHFFVCIYLSKIQGKVSVNELSKHLCSCYNTIVGLSQCSI